jgi:hypothetical protein
MSRTLFPSADAEVSALRVVLNTVHAILDDAGLGNVYARVSFAKDLAKPYLEPLTVEEPKATLTLTAVSDEPLTAETLADMGIGGTDPEPDGVPVDIDEQVEEDARGRVERYDARDGLPPF